MSALRTVLSVLKLVAVLLLFFVSIELMGDSFKLMGKGVVDTLLTMTTNPFVGLFIGVLTTSLVQSSSTVTTMTVTLVASGGLTIAGAIPIVMGANIGTSVTNTMVSLGHVTRKDEFSRAIAGATVHDFFNLLSVLILFPMEISFQLISRIAAVLTEGLQGVGGTKLLSPLKELVDPVVDVIIHLFQSNGFMVLLAGLALLFLSLRFLVKILKGAVLSRSEEYLHKYIFSSVTVSLLFGVLLTVLVQSSSITTSITVPLVAAGLLRVDQIFPFVLGANIGTTITSLLAALAFAAGGTLEGIAALKVAFAHLSFNVLGTALFLPIRFLRNIPIRLAEALGRLAVVNRFYALGYLLTVFFVIPILVIVLTSRFDIEYTPVVPDSLNELVESDTPIDSTTIQDSLAVLPQRTSE
jgi:sodium-dependent phosphate cotransporter